MLNIKNVREMMSEICASINANEKLLCELDSFVGDGDHGVTINRGFTAVMKKLNENEYETISEIFAMAEETLTETMGGAIGPIFGSVFAGFAEGTEDISEIGTAEFANMFQNGLDNVQMIGGAQEGDRTLVDSLAPAVRALNEASENGLSVADALKKAEESALLGVENTKTMVAKKGRAKFLGEKSLDHQDAGATSMYVVIKAISDYCAK